MQSDRIYENMSATLASGPHTSVMTEEDNKEDNTEGSINNQPLSDSVSNIFNNAKISK